MQYKKYARYVFRIFECREYLRRESHSVITAVNTKHMFVFTVNSYGILTVQNALLCMCTASLSAPLAVLLPSCRLG